MVLNRTVAAILRISSALNLIATYRDFQNVRHTQILEEKSEAQIHNYLLKKNQKQKGSAL